MGTTLIPHLPTTQDEPFHVAQTQAYCRGEWTSWDPKITTPPGLYAVGVATAGVLRALDAALRSYARPLPTFCGTTHLRLANAVGAGAAFYTAGAVARRLHPRGGGASAALAAAWVATLPTHAFYAWLYYTDVWALAAVLACWAASLNGRPWLAAVAGAVAITFRQTAAVWVAFVAGDALLRVAVTHAASSRTAWPAQPDVVRQAVAAVRALAAAPRAAAAVAATLLLPLAAFSAAVVANGGSIALGDKSNHAPSKHWAHPLYAAVAAALALAPAHLTLPHLRTLTRYPLTPVGARRTALAVSAAVTAAAAGTIVHPFLLADNRHYTFYLWRALQHHTTPTLRPLAVGGAATLMAGWLVTALSSARAGGLWMLGWAVAAALTLVPAPLIEPRYFTAAIVIAALKLGPPARPLTSLLLNVAALTAVVWVFLGRPFGQGEEVARFMF